MRASVNDETNLLVGYMTQELQEYRVAAFYSDDLTGISGIEALRSSLQYLGAPILCNTSYVWNSSDPTTAFSQFKASIASSGQTPGAIFLYGINTVRTCCSTAFVSPT